MPYLINVILVVVLDIDFCASDPCKNSATCESRDTDYECKCLPGYSGTDCEIGKYYHFDIFVRYFANFELDDNIFPVINYFQHIMSFKNKTSNKYETKVSYL